MYRISKEHRSADKSFEEWKTQREEGRFSTLSLENWQEWEGKKVFACFFWSTNGQHTWRSLIFFFYSWQFKLIVTVPHVQPCGVQVNLTDGLCTRDLHCCLGFSHRSLAKESGKCLKLFSAFLWSFCFSVFWLQILPDILHPVWWLTPLSAMFSHSNMRVPWADWKPTVRFLPRLAEVGRLCSVFAKTGWLCWWFFSCEGLSSASLWVLRCWPGTSSLLKGAVCSFRWPSLRLGKRKHS